MRYLFSGVSSFFRLTITRRNSSSKATLRSVVSSGTPVEIERYFSQFGPEASQVAGSQLDQMDTPLHLAAWHNTLAGLKTVLRILGPRAIRTTKIVNHHGKIPLDLIRHNPHVIDNQNAYTRYFTALLTPTAQHLLPPIHASIKLDVIEKAYAYLDPNSQVFSNLIMAAKAVNLVRSKIEISSTHPTINPLPETDKVKIVNRIRKMRERIHKAGLALSLTSTDKKYQEIVVRFVDQYRCGNCGEYSRITYEILVNEFKLKCKFGQVVNGDHGFVVVDPDPDGGNDYKRWGKNAVVCDAWAGSVFLAREVPTELRTFQYYANAELGVTANVCSFFNPVRHQLQLKEIVDRSPSFSPIVTQYRG